MVVDTVPVVLRHQAEAAPLVVQFAMFPPQSPGVPRQEVCRVELEAGLVGPHLHPPPSERVLQTGHVADIDKTHVDMLRTEQRAHQISPS